MFQSIFSINKWLSIAAIAYLIGALVEGVGAANQLFRSTPELVKDSEASSSPSVQPWVGKCQVFAAITAVSVCGGFSWPCRLIHRSIKESRDCQEK